MLENGDVCRILMSMTMKRYLFRRMMFMAVFLMLAVAAIGQKGLNVDNVFQRYGRAKGCKMVVMENTTLHGYKLRVYKSLVYKKLHHAVKPYLDADRKNAKKVREVIDGGELVSGYYMMKPLPGGYNRYILFSYVDSRKGTVIYIEGKLSPDDILKLCYSKY